MNAKGEYAGVTMYRGSAQFAICNDKGPQTLPVMVLRVDREIKKTVQASQCRGQVQLSTST